MSLTDALTLKDELCKEVGRLLGPELRAQALRDSHARRRPIGCGLTVHIGYGCDNMCAYCYVPDMGFGFTVKPSPLTPLQLVYALLSNPYFVPGPLGTFLALGSVCDPLHPVLIDKTIDFISCFREYMGNPIQLSTKMAVDEETARRLRKASKGMLSPLVTIVTIRASRLLEPKAPSPHMRLESISNLRAVGLKPHVFIRPVIPGVTDVEAEEILRESARHGAVGAVIGDLRLTKRIVERLRAIGLDVQAIVTRAKTPISSSRQVVVDVGYERRMIVRLARSRGMVAHLRACCANAYDHEVPCMGSCWETRSCTRCPNNCLTKLPEVDEAEVLEALSYLGVKARSIHVTRNTLVIHAAQKVPGHVKYVLATYYRRRVRLT